MSINILFIGGTRRGYDTLRAIVDAGFRVGGVISLRQDDHEVERYEDRMRELAEEHAIPCFETKWMKDRDYHALIAEELRPDVAIVVGCRIMISEQVYSIPPLGTLAVHDSLLPEYRGFAPLNWSIINGEDHVGVSLFQLGPEMDAGDVVAQKRVAIGPEETAPQVYERVCSATIDVVLEALPQIALGQMTLTAQDHAAATFTCSRTPSDGTIDWNASTRDIFNRIRALTWPYPGATTYHNGQRLFVWSATIPNPMPQYVGRVPGRVVALGVDGSVDVLTGDGVIRIHDVGLTSDEKVPATSIIKSVRTTLGLRPEDVLARIATLEQQLDLQKDIMVVP